MKITDKQRLDWLQKARRTVFSGVCGFCVGTYEYRPTLRLAIDAAIRAEKAGRKA